MSSERIRSKCFVLFLFAAFATANNFAQTTSGTASPKRTTPTPAQDRAGIFQHGQTALSNSQLDQAERDFRKVLELDPQAGAAYADLGVIYMRRRRVRTKSPPIPRKGRTLIPQVAGIRLNIGLAYFRQNEFLKAIPPFESVVRDLPNAVQPRYLLGLCYFFADRWAEAADALEPLWDQESDKFPYLYVLSNAAHRAGKTALDDRATSTSSKLEMVRLNTISSSGNIISISINMTRLNRNSKPLLPAIPSCPSFISTWGWFTRRNRSTPRLGTNS